MPINGVRNAASPSLGTEPAMSATLSAPRSDGPGSPPTPPTAQWFRRSLFGIGLGAAGLLLALTAWNQATSSSSAEDISLRPAGHIDQVDLSVESGTIEIITGDEILLEAGASDGSDFVLNHDVTDGNFAIRVTCPGLAWWGSCRTPVRLVVPTGIPVAADIDAGTITASGLTAGVDLRTDAGAIDVRDLEGIIRLRSEAGPLRGTIRSGSIDAATSVGPITLMVMDDLSRLSASTEVGAIDLMVPEADYQIDASTTLGRTNVELDSAASASREIKVRSELGSVTIRPTTSSDGNDH